MINNFASLVRDQRIHIIPSFTFESGVTLTQVPVAYKTWGQLNDQCDNAMVICHALSGSSDVEDWWGPLLGPNRSFDTNVFFIICCNILASPYGTASPLTVNPNTAKCYGPEFPQPTIRDTVNLHRIVLDALGVKQIQTVIGGSMGGMQVLEWTFFGIDYVKSIVPLATSGKNSAWCISWGETQRQTIHSDPNFKEGWYGDNPPNHGLGIARMTALLTYRSRNSFEERFGRVSQQQKEHSKTFRTDGNEIFKAESYLHYQGTKFVNRFDANCYILITKMMDSHDVSRGRGDYEDVLRSIVQPALIVGVATDGLFTLEEQQELATHLPNSELVVIQSPDGHDGFLLEFEQIDENIQRFLKANVPARFYEKGLKLSSEGKAVKDSLFGEIEDPAAW